MTPDTQYILWTIQLRNTLTKKRKQKQNKFKQKKI